MDLKELLEKENIKFCSCGRLTTMLLPDFEWKDGRIVREIGKSCPKCKIEKNDGITITEPFDTPERAMERLRNES